MILKPTTYPGQVDQGINAEVLQLIRRSHTRKKEEPGRANRSCRQDDLLTTPDNYFTLGSSALDPYCPPPFENHPADLCPLEDAKILSRCRWSQVPHSSTGTNTVCLSKLVESCTGLLSTREVIVSLQPLE